MNRRNRYNRNSNVKKERIIMIASSAFVLAALTMTGVYVKENSRDSRNDGYSIDFNTLENSANEKYKEIAQNNSPVESKEEIELDYPVDTQQVDSGIVQIPGLTDGTLTGIENAVTDPAQESLMEEVNPAPEEGAEVASQDVAAEPKLSFKEGDSLVWPVSGNVLINYSMDKTVYFATLAQYKYNPGIVIAAEEGTSITAAAAGKVTSIYYDEEIGNAVTVDIGSGYEITYGQLKDIGLSKGDYIKAGDLIGNVAAPTKYYSVEGSNVYFSLTHDDTPVDPMGKLQ